MRVLILFCLLFQATPIFSQKVIPDVEAIKNISNQILIIQYVPKAEKVNRIINETLQKYWTTTDSVIYNKSLKELKEIVKSAPDKFVILYFTGKPPILGVGAPNRDELILFHDEEYVLSNDLRMTLRLGEDLNHNIALFANPVPLFYTSPDSLKMLNTTFYCAIQELQYFVDAYTNPEKYADMKTYKKWIMEKTLLINKHGSLAKLDKETIQSIYPYPFELVDFPKIEKVILSNDKEYLYIRRSPITRATFSYYLINAENGMFLSQAIGTKILYKAIIQKMVKSINKLYK